VAKVGTSNSDRTISLRLQCVVKRHNIKQGKTRKNGTRPAFFYISCYLCCSMYCLCVNVYCYRVTTQLQLIGISKPCNYGILKATYNLWSYAPWKGPLYLSILPVNINKSDGYFTCLQSGHPPLNSR
jgi:hypothetical protein